MGTIVIEEHDRSGLNDNTYTPVYNLSKLLARTADATTSTTAESLALNTATSILRIYTDVAHRIGLSSASTNNGGVYFTTAAGWNDLAVTDGNTIYYRTDA
jgi:hypothetical protein